MGSATNTHAAHTQTDNPPTPTLRDIVAAKVGSGGEMTYAAFGKAAIDPESGRKVSAQVAQSIISGLPIKVAPQVLGAIAAAIGEHPERLRRAAAREYTGVHLDYDPELDYMPRLHDMDFDPIPDEHGTDIGVTTDRDPGNLRPAPRSRAAILKRVRRIEDAQREAANQPEMP